MLIPEAFATILPAAWAKLSPLFYSFLIYLAITAINSMVSSWHDKIEANRKAQDSTVLQVKDGIAEVVLFVNGQFADQYRKSNPEQGIPPEKAKEFFNKAFEAARAQYLPKLTNYVGMAEHLAEEWIRIQIEAQLTKLKFWQKVPPLSVPPVGSPTVAGSGKP